MVKPQDAAITEARVASVAAPGTRPHAVLREQSPGLMESEGHVDERPWADLARTGLVALRLRLWEPFPHFSVIGLFVLIAEMLEGLTIGRGCLLGALRITDVLRPEAKQAVAALRQKGIRTILLTGDAKTIATAVGQELGIDEVGAELLPEQKLDRIKALLAAGKTVAMIGDGINDAPAVMWASVGIAMGSGTDVARESANVMLLGNDLLKIVETLEIARRCHGIIMANFAGTLIVDGVGVGLAAFGLLNPLLAAFIHVTSELAFILNSARLLPAASRK